MATIYWNREVDEHYLKACAAFKKVKKGRDTSLESLNDFATFWTERWHLYGERFPYVYVVPNFSNIPNKDNSDGKRYRTFLETTILTHKVGMTRLNIDTLELTDSVRLVSEFIGTAQCPLLIKEDYNKPNMFQNEERLTEWRR